MSQQEDASVAGHGKHDGVRPSAIAWAATALDLFVSAISNTEVVAPQTPESGAFYDQLCKATCESVGSNRAVILLYDEARKRVRPVGACGIDHKLLKPFEGVGLENASSAREALEQDRVVETESLPDVIAQEPLVRESVDLFGVGAIAYVPISAGSSWFGVMLIENPSSEQLSQGQKDILWITGKVVALASVSRQATRLQEQSHQLIQRLALARRVHDQVIQRLFGVGLLLASDQALEGEMRTRAVHEIESAQAELRQLMRGRQREAPHQVPTTLRLRDEVERLKQAHDTVTVTYHQEEQIELSVELESLAQSVLGEAVRNALKHGDPTILQVSLTKVGDAIALTVDSDGPRRGDPSKAGLGLRLSAAEALQVGALLEFGARGGGESWRVRLLMPPKPL